MEVYPVIVQFYGDARAITFNHFPTQGNEQRLNVRKNDIGFGRLGDTTSAVLQAMWNLCCSILRYL